MFWLQSHLWPVDSFRLQGRESSGAPGRASRLQGMEAPVQLTRSLAGASTAWRRVGSLPWATERVGVVGTGAQLVGTDSSPSWGHTIFKEPPPQETLVDHAAAPTPQPLEGTAPGLWVPSAHSLTCICPEHSPGSGLSSLAWSHVHEMRIYAWKGEGTKSF